MFQTSGKILPIILENISHFNKAKIPPKDVNLFSPVALGISRVCTDCARKPSLRTLNPSIAQEVNYIHFPT